MVRAEVHLTRLLLVAAAAKHTVLSERNDWQSAMNNDADG